MTAFIMTCQVFGKIVCSPYWYWLCGWVRHGVLLHAFSLVLIRCHKAKAYDAFEVICLDKYMLGGYYDNTYYYVNAMEDGLWMHQRGMI